MDQKYLVVGDSDELIPVIDAYAFQYDYGTGRLVLRVTIDADVKSFDELRALFSEDVVIKEYEDQVVSDDDAELPTIRRSLIRSFEHFCKDYTFDYDSSTNRFNIEVARKTDTELEVETMESETIDGYVALAEIYES